MSTEFLRTRLPAAVLAAVLGGTALVAGCTTDRQPPQQSVATWRPNTDHVGWEIRTGAPMYADADEHNQCATTSQEARVVPSELEDLGGGRELFMIPKSDLPLVQPNSCPETIYTDGK